MYCYFIYHQERKEYPREANKETPPPHMKLGPQKPAPSVRRETRKEIVPHRKGPEGSLNASALALSKGGKEHLPWECEPEVCRLNSLYQCDLNKTLRHNSVQVASVGGIPRPWQKQMQIPWGGIPSHSRPQTVLRQQQFLGHPVYQLY